MINMLLISHLTFNICFNHKYVHKQLICSYFCLLPVWVPLKPRLQAVSVWLFPPRLPFLWLMCSILQPDFTVLNNHVRDWWGAAQKNGSDQESSADSGILKLSSGVCRRSCLSALCLITACLAGRWACSILVCIQAWRRPSDTKETEAERLNGGEAGWGGGNVWGQDGGKWQLHGQETDFSYHLITAGPSLGDWIKEMHLVFACCSGNWAFSLELKSEFPFLLHNGSYFREDS